VAEKLNINATPNQEVGRGSSFMTYGICKLKYSSTIEKRIIIAKGIAKEQKATWL